MENTNQPSSPDDLNAANLALAERIGVLERQIKEQRARAGAASDSPMQPGELSAELERHRDQLRDYEKALVERIADVDDDRRATASRLQRAWQTQRGEIDDRLRRHAGVVAGSMLLFAVAVAVALFVIYRQATTAPPQIAEELAEVRQELNRVAGDLMPGDRVRGELARLGAEVEGIASSLKNSDQDEGQADRAAVAAERSARENGEARISEEILRLDAERTRLAGELAALRSALEAAEPARAAQAAAAKAATAESLPEPGAGVPAADADSSADEPAVDTGPEAGDEGAPPGAPGAADEPPAQIGESPTSADEDADALGSEETIVAGEESYALQLIGFFNRDSLADFATKEGLPARVFYIRQTYRGRPWYAMVHSLHRGYASAVEALSGLSEDLVALNPWIWPVPPGTELRVLESGRRQGAGSE